MAHFKAIFNGVGKKSRTVSDVSASDQGTNGGAPSSNPGSTTNISQSSPSLITPGDVLSLPDGVRVWHDCPDATVDVCFVHGLTGNRESTWTAHGQSAPWPKTLLPLKLPKARLLTYGYDAYIIQKPVASTNRLIDHATNLVIDLTNDRASCKASSRPLIFVAHSLGGLVCKEAILFSRNNPEAHFRGIFACFIGIVFMGTPHKGSWMADWANIPASALGLIKSTNKSLLAILQTDNQLLESIQVRFWSMVRELREGGRRLEVTCFFEELPLPVAGQVVPKESATLEGYISVSVHANHSEMVKFSSAEDTGFRRLLGELTRWEELVKLASSSELVIRQAIPYRLVAADAATNCTVLPYHHIPFPKNKRFAGRDSTLDALKQLFFTQECQRVAVLGLGGVGKTQVALQFAYWAKENKPDYSIFWIPALSNASFEQAYTEVARKLPVRRDTDDKDLNKSVQRYLSSEVAGPWLLVVDNADDMDMFFGNSDTPGGISEYLPENGQGLILFTTRSRGMAVSVADNNVVELQEMDAQEAASFLEKSLIRKDLLYDKISVIELLKRLTYLPLAITQAAAYINTNQVSIADYLGLLRGTEQDIISLMSRQFHDSTRYKDSQNAVATTWLVSFDQIRKSDRAAADLLSFISRIEPKAIPRSILPGPELEEQMVHAIGTLCAYKFLVRRGENTIFDMHSLVHLATRIWVHSRGDATQMTEQANRHLARAFPTNDYSNRSLWREYLPHALRVLQGDEGRDMKERYSLCIKVGRCLQADGRIKEAVKCFEESYQWMKDHFAEDHPSRLASQHALAGAYDEDGQVDKAVKLLEYIVVMQEKILPEDHPSRLASQHELAGAYDTDGQVDKAIKLLEQVITIEEKMLAEDHPSRLASQHALARAYYSDGQVNKAVKLLEHVVAVQERTLSEDHLDQLAAQHVLATAYGADGQVAKAVKLLEYVVTVQEKTLTEDHPYRLAAQHELATGYRVDGQVDKAVKLLEHVVTVQERTLAEDHPSQLSSQYALARAYYSDGQVQKAIGLLNYVVLVEQRVLRKDHPSRLISQRALASWSKADV
jgi:tetratricopeptide (TPR) repeat protein